MKKSSSRKKRILVAPLNWGLGHATRCIPVIKALITHNFEPIIGSDGGALNLLRHEFPQLKTVELPSYNITYSKKSNNFKFKLLKDSPYILTAIKKEKKAMHQIVEQESISGIISDNRFGIRHKEIPSVFITHQIRVLSGNTTWLSSKLHQKVISKFNECWIPDHIGSPNLSGDLGHLENYHHKFKYIGPLSRLNKENLELTYDLLVILSGPEPQRAYLEQHLLTELESFKGNICFVKGTIEPSQYIIKKENMIIYNYMTSEELQCALNKSRLVLSRSGYTSIMDFAKLEKKAFLIPTPGQFEQEYLAKKFEKEGIAATCSQKDFKVDMLNASKNYSGFSHVQYEVNYKKLFRLFESE